MDEPPEQPSEPARSGRGEGPAESPERLLSTPFVLAFAASLLTNLSFHAQVHLPGYLHELHAGELETGTIMAAFAAAAIVVRPLAGRLMDARGRRLVVLAGALVQLAGCALYLTVETIGPWVYVVRLIHGLGQGATISVLFTVAADTVPVARRTHGIALFGISGMLPVSLAALMGEAVLAAAGYAELFLAQTVLAGASLACLIALPESRPDGDASDPPSRGFFRTLADPSLRPLWLVGLGFALGIGSTFTFLKTYVLHTGVGTVGMFFTPYAGCAIGLRLLFGWLPDRRGPARTLAPALALVVAGLALVAYAGSGLELMVAGALCGSGHGFAFPIISSLVVTRAPAVERGAAVSLFTALFDAGVLVGGPLLGAVAEHSSHRTMFLLAGAVTAAAAVGFRVRERRAIARERGAVTST